jgi:hypothetical protein
MDAQKYEVEYSAGGYPSPTYTGTKMVWAFGDDAVREKAIREIAREGCWGIGSVHIKKITKEV